MLNIISSESATIYSQLHSLDPDVLFNALSSDTEANSFHYLMKTNLRVLLSQINTIYHSVNTINTQFNTEYDTTALPLLQGGLLHQQSYLDKTITMALPDIEKFTCDKLYWEEKLAVIIQSEEIIHQRGFQSIFGTTTLPTAEQLKDVELSSSERFILNELQRVISAVVNTLTEGLSYAQLVDTRTTVSQRIYDLSKIIRNLKKT